jgi:hypothetical protein
MKAFLYVISVFWIAMGSCFILYTSECRRVLSNMLRGVDRRFLAPLPAVIGILLMLSATQARNAGFLRFLGLLAVAKAAFIYGNPKGLYEQLLEWYLDRASDQTFRFLGIIALILGTAVLSWIL